MKNNKFKLGDKAFFIERDWYLNEVLVRYGNENEYNRFDGTKCPFEIVSVKHVQSKDIYGGAISENIVYDLAYVSDDKFSHNPNICYDIPEEDICLSVNSAHQKAVEVFNSIRWN